MSKKIISLLLAVMLTVSMVAVAAVSVSAEEGAEATYIVAGSADVFGSDWGWTDENNIMTDEDGDGIYELVIPNAGPFVNTQFKIGVNGIDGEGSIGPNGDGTIGPDSPFNFQFNIDDTCDLTITFNPATNEVTYTGDYLSEYVFSVEEMRIVGNGGFGWVNDINWDQAADENLMDEIAPGVYQIVMYDVEGNSNAEFKFAADGSWGVNWGGTFAGFDVETEAVYNSGSNIALEIGGGDDDLNLYTVTVTLDISNFNPTSNTGATFTVSQELQEEDDTTEPTEATTEEPTEATTEEPTEATDVTEATTAAGAPLTVNATSNFFSKAEAQYNADTNEVTVAYYINCDKSILNFQIGTKDVESTVIDGITYDPTVLKVSDDWKPRNTLPMTGAAGCAINLTGVEGSIKLNGSNLNLWDIDPDEAFVEVKFEVLDLSGKGPVTTTIDCEVESMIVANLNADETEVDSATEDYLIRNKLIVDENVAKNNASAITKLTPESNYIPDETAAPDTTETPTNAPDTTEAPTDAPDTTEAPTDAPDTTEAPTDADPDTTAAPSGNLITADSNLLPTDTYEAKVGETVTVEYSLKADILQTQWTLIYDPEVLELVTASDLMPQITSGADYNSSVAGQVEASASNLDLYNVTADNAFVSAQFKKIAEGDTTVSLVFSVLKTAELNEDGTVNEDSETYVVFNGQISEDTSTVSDFNTVIIPVESDTTAPEEPGTTTAPEDDTTAPVEPDTTVAPEDDTTAAPEETGTTAAPEVPTQPTTGAGSSTSDTPTSPSGNAGTTTSTGNGTVQTGDASMAIIILSVLVAGTAVMFVLRKREMF